MKLILCFASPGKILHPQPGLFKSRFVTLPDTISNWYPFTCLQLFGFRSHFLKFNVNQDAVPSMLIPLLVELCRMLPPGLQHTHDLRSIKKGTNYAQFFPFFPFSLTHNKTCTDVYTDMYTGGLVQTQC